MREFDPLALDADTMQTYLYLCTLAGNDGIVQTEKDEIAARLGITTATLAKRLRRLEDATWLKRDRIGRICLKTSVVFHRVFNNAPIDSSEIHKNTPQKSEHTESAPEPKDVLARWSLRYRERYGVSYRYSNYPACLNAAAALLRTYGPTILDIIDAVFANYDMTWKNRNFPTPSFGQLSTWLAKQALAYVDKSNGSKVDVKELI